MRWLRFAVIILVFAMLQTGLVGIIAVSPAEIRPNLLLIALVFFSIHGNPYDAIITSFAIGFAADIIGPAMGPQMISFGIFGTLLADLHRVIAIRKIPYQAAAMFAVGSATAALTYLLTFLKGQPSASNIYAQLLWTPIYSAVVGPFLFLPMGWWMRIRTRRLSRY